jgi:hypothetical protein
MRIAKNDIPVLIDAPGAVARQRSDFGKANGTMGAEYFSLGAGADLAPLLEGLEHDLCQSEHWGYVIDGALAVTYEDGTAERCVTGDMLHWPAGHTVRAEEDTDFILFSPQDTHLPVLSHVKSKMGL